MKRIWSSNKKVWLSALNNVGQKSNFSTSQIVMANKSYKLVVVGGGAGGCSVAAKFAGKFGKDQCAVIEPSDMHYYQPMWTLVGGGIKSFEQTGKPMGKVLPKNATWLKTKAVSFNPDQNKLTTEAGDEISYEFLVIAMGLTLDYGQIKGLPEAFETPGVCSNYHPEYVKKTWPTVQSFKEGNAVFTFPATPIKCAGAPQKIMYLTDYNLRQMGKRDKANVIYHSSLPVIFGVKKYADALWEVVKERDIQVNLRSNLIEVKPDSKEAIFQNLDKPEELTTVKYEMLHVTPPQTPPKALKTHEKLVDPAGFLNVVKETTQHAVYPNIFGVGDCTSIPTAKTAAAVAAEVGILRQNLKAAMAGKSLPAKYDGYTSCPLVISPKECILAEFDFQVPPQPLETLPINQAKPSRLSYMMKSHLMPQLYWTMMLNGMWEGPKYVRKAFHLGMK